MNIEYWMSYTLIVSSSGRFSYREQMRCNYKHHVEANSFIKYHPRREASLVFIPSNRASGFDMSVIGV